MSRPVDQLHAQAPFVSRYSGNVIVHAYRALGHSLRFRFDGVAGSPYERNEGDDPYPHYGLGYRLCDPDTQGVLQRISPGDQRSWLALRHEMLNYRPSHKTIVVFLRVEVGVSVTDDLFPMPNLEF